MLIARTEFITSYDKLFKSIAECGLDIEAQYLKKPYDDFAIITWGMTPRFTDSTPPCPGNVRSDEIIFESLDVTVHQNWIAGHPRAVIKLAACSIDIPKIGFDPWPSHRFTKSQTSTLIWMSQRIGLRVYGMLT
jgi:hypothetical protein